MKKIIITILVAMTIFGSIVYFKPFGIISKDQSEFVFDDDTVLEKFDDADFFVEIIDESNMPYKINIEFTGDGEKYVGTAYLPGDVDPADCLLSWSSDEDVQISKRLKKYESGEFGLAGAEYSTIFVVDVNGNKYDFMLKSLKGSADVSPLLISIDENEGSILDMNGSLDHSISCYGSAHFNDSNYYISIKGRGNASWKFCPKKPYNITFLKEAYDGKKAVSMIEGVESKKWSILANYADPSLLRNKVGYELALKMGIGLPSEYYDVWMNGEYLGNYLVTPKNDYKAADNGFILELDNYVDDEDPQFYLYNDNGRINSLRFTVKDDSAELGSEMIASWIQEAWDAITDYDSENYQKYIDADSWAKMYILHEVYKNYDVVNGSILMHRDGTSESDKLIAGPIWDLDNALGTTNWNYPNGTDFYTTFSADEDYIQSVSLEDNDYCWLKELGKHSSFIEKVDDIYSTYKDEINELINCIEENGVVLGSSAHMNVDKWGITREGYNNFFLKEELEFYDPYPFKYVSPQDYYDYVMNLKAYVNARLSYMNDWY